VKRKLQSTESNKLPTIPNKHRCKSAFKTQER